jgi:hypothetical protein
MGGRIYAAGHAAADRKTRRAQKMGKTRRLLLAVQTTPTRTNYRNSEVILPGQAASYVENGGRVVNLLQRRRIPPIVQVNNPDRKFVCQLQFSGRVEFVAASGHLFSRLKADSAHFRQLAY